MGIGASLFLIAVGAVMAWGINVDSTSGFDINTIGVILMVVGAIGAVVSLLFWSSFSPYGDRRSVVRRQVVDDV